MVPLPPDATLISCSDGVTEARNATGAFYPLAERLEALAHISSWRVANYLAEDLSRHTAGEHRDDITALVVRRTALNSDFTRAPDPAWRHPL